MNHIAGVFELSIHVFTAFVDDKSLVRLIDTLSHYVIYRSIDTVVHTLINNITLSLGESFFLMEVCLVSIYYCLVVKYISKVNIVSTGTCAK